jgi:hypothetical protein
MRHRCGKVVAPAMEESDASVRARLPQRFAEPFIRAQSFLVGREGIGQLIQVIQFAGQPELD